ncbi:MAG TPA: FxSxx-COOH system tetratricopeptide repeat protein [Streptomyces sp.]|nr:FxSxx-COOH system tetratricopeptide repeat protein [Streptomyces sp.]
MTISFAGYHRAWAAWIGHRLERRGLRVVQQRWDPPADVPLVTLLRDLHLAVGRVLIVADDWYFRLGLRTEQEWNAALREVVAPDPSRFAAVSVTDSPLPSAAAVLAPVDLADVDAEGAERRLLERLDLPSDPLPEFRRGPRFPLAGPDVWGAVPRRNTRFTGREDLFNELYHLLRDARPGAGVVTLHGMSGGGKTQLAVEYAYRFGSEYDVVWWVNADTRVTYRRQLAELAPKLGLQTGQEYGERLRAVRDSLWRGEPFSRWLLILDGADDPEHISDLVPTGPGHVLITSRNPDWSEHDSHLLEVPVYARAESVAFIRRRAPRLTEPEADHLAETLEDLPLLLDQTAGWLNDTDLSVGEYTALLEGGIDTDVVKVSADSPLTFQTVWSILLNRLRETAPAAVELLRLCTFFAPGPIPVHLLRNMPLDGLSPSLTELLSSASLWNRAVDRLRAYSVVRVESYETDAARETFHMHRTVHQTVRRGIPGVQRRELTEVVRRALAAADPRKPTEPRLWPEYAEIMPHLPYASVLKSEDPAVQDLVLNCLRYMYFSGEYLAGIGLGEHALKAWRALLGPTHPRIWELTYHHANLLRAAGEYDRAEAFSREAVNHLREERGPQDLEHLRAASGLGGDLRGLARYDEALELSRWVLAAYRDLLGEQDSRTLNAQNNLAVSLRLLGRYQEALETDRATMEARRRQLGQRHPWSLNSEIAYATDLRLLGRYGDAQAVQAGNVGENRIVMGPGNPQTLRAEYNLALCRHLLGGPGRGDRHEGPGAMFSGVLERGERALGETHPLTLIFAAAQSCYAREHGDIDQARELGETVVSRYEAMLPEGHPFIAGSRANQALILRTVGERENGHDLAEQALAGMVRAVGKNHPWTLGCAMNASGLRHLVGDVEGATDLSRDTATRAAASLGRTHPLTLCAHIAYAADLRALGRGAEADGTEHQALSALDAALGPRHPLTVSARARVRPHWDFEPQHT